MRRLIRFEWKIKAFLTGSINELEILLLFEISVFAFNSLIEKNLFMEPPGKMGIFRSSNNKYWSLLEN